MTATINPTILNALTLKWAREKANFDDQENRQRINYNSALDKMRRVYDDTSLSARENLSDRGILHSGPALVNQTRLRDDYNRQQSEAGLAHNVNLATLARRRLETDQEFNIQKLLASMGQPISL